MVAVRKKTYACPFPGCSQTFASRGGRIGHINNHKGLRPYTCTHDGCDKAFTHRGNMLRHELIHLELKPHVCTDCNAAFNCQSNLVRHRRYHHLQEEYPCDFEGCDKCFSTPCGLRSHMAKHSDDRKHTCQQCQKTFKRSSDLLTHVKVHDSTRQYVCIECGKAFKTSQHLSTHKTSHREQRNFVCSQCSKSFKSSAALCNHEKTHSGIKRFKCQAVGCDASFYISGNLQRHEKSFHTEEGAARQKKSEQATADVLLNSGLDFKREQRTYHDCLAATWSSTDFLVAVPGGVCDVENDETQHDGYSVACEVARMMKIYSCRQLDGYTLPQMFVRFNPDAFRVDGKLVRGIGKLERRQALAEYLKTVDLRGAPPLQIVYMYYDGVREGDGLVPRVFQDPEFDPCVAAVSRLHCPGLSI